MSQHGRTSIEIMSIYDFYRYTMTNIDDEKKKLNKTLLTRLELVF